MIFDDHDIRDDWNTSWTWHEEINRTPWWHERLMGGLSSYWVYQHLGNLSPAELAADVVYARALEQAAADALPRDGAAEVDLTEPVFDLSRRVDRHPEVYRWSYRRDLGDCRLVVVDSRAARVLEPDRRSMLDPDEMAWLDEQLTGDVEHLFIGTSLPFLLPPGLHDFEAIDEVLAEGAHGRLVADGCRARPPQHRPRALGGLQRGLRRGLRHRHGRGPRQPWPGARRRSSSSPETCTTPTWQRSPRRPRGTGPSRASCRPSAPRSAIPMPRAVRVMMSAFARSLVRPMRVIAERSKRVPDPAYPWLVTDGPWFDNCLAQATIQGPDLAIAWRGGEVRDGDDLHPVLTTVGAVRVPGRHADDPASGVGESPADERHTVTR